jgi:hypothetical protein
MEYELFEFAKLCVYDVGCIGSPKLLHVLSRVSSRFYRIVKQRLLYLHNKYTLWSPRLAHAFHRRLIKHPFTYTHEYTRFIRTPHAGRTILPFAHIDFNPDYTYAVSGIWYIATLPELQEIIQIGNIGTQCSTELVDCTDFKMHERTIDGIVQRTVNILKSGFPFELNPLCMQHRHSFRLGVPMSHIHGITIKYKITPCNNNWSANFRTKKGQYAPHTCSVVSVVE